MREALLKAHTDHEMLPQAVAALEMKKKRTISDSRSTTIPKKREYDGISVVM